MTIFVVTIRDAVDRIGAQRVADELRVSRATVLRWVAGRGLPHPIAQAEIVKAMVGIHER